MQMGAAISDDEQHFPKQLSDIGRLVYTLVCHRHHPPPTLCLRVHSHSFSTSKTPIDNICDEEKAHSTSRYRHQSYI